MHIILYVYTCNYSTEKFVEADEYEDLPTENSMVHVAAGCTAGIAEHCAMYPVDLVKVNSLFRDVCVIEYWQ